MLFKTEKNIFSVSEQYFNKAHKNSDFRRAKDSWRATTWVVEASSLRGYPKLVAIIIASHYNKNKGYAYISHETLAEEAGVSAATINRAIRDIKLSGEWIVISGRKDWDKSGKKQGHTANKYLPLAPNPNDTLNSSGKWISWLKLKIKEDVIKNPKVGDSFKEPRTKYLEHYKEYVSDYERLTMWFRGGVKDPDMLDIYPDDIWVAPIPSAEDAEGEIPW
jgi:hypothetical protein